MQPDLSTPMMKQYLAIKKQYQDCLLFYRMGDFYELFLEDAHIGAKILNITLTGKSNGKNGRIPMAGVPYHAVDTYLAKLVKAGYKVAICEQLSPPNTRGLVERDVVRIVTPGTVLDEKTLEKKKNNYIISLAFNKTTLAISIADISTGYFATTQTPTDHLEQTLKNELARIQPAECILSEDAYNNPEFLKLLRAENINIFPFHNWTIYTNNAAEHLKKHFGTATLAGFAIEDKKLATETSAALLGYLQETQKGTVGHMKKITNLASDASLVLDRSTIFNLELFTTIREHDSRGTLLSVMDETITPMGGRMLKQWMQKPLVDKQTINKRHELVTFLLKKREKRQKVREQLETIIDIERLISRLSVGLGNARDLVNLSGSLKNMLIIKKQMQSFNSPLFAFINKGISKNIETVIAVIDKHIVPEPPLSIREGGMLQSGINKELDKLRKVVNVSRDWILELEKTEREKTSIASLKVRFNQVFGFYIEVSKANLDLVPKTYIRKQTLVNGERFITEDLKKQEEIILTAEEKINDLEYQLFQEVLAQILQATTLMQEASAAVAQLDCLTNFAFIAEKYHYIRPKITTGQELHITQGRHPVVEKLLEEKQFVPNDVLLDDKKQQLLLITGPNMAGKSVLIRQVALIVLMNQMGSFVPAEKASLPLVDRIFVRSGASDIITSGLSTFMVEMVETANILHHATKNSLIIMDEIGRGTSTYDGISIAWAVAEYLVKANGSKTLFATHYHELQILEEQFPKQIKNYHMAVTEDQGDPVFLHTLQPGGASHSFGVAVAKLAGIPETVITRAKILLHELETRNQKKTEEKHFETIQSMNLADILIHSELEALDIANMTPLEALNVLSELKDKLKLVTMQNKDILHAD